MNRPATLLSSAAAVLLAVVSIQPLRSAQTAPVSPTLAGDPAHPASAPNWVETKLYFAISGETPGRAPASESEWQSFLDHEITPRFPAGLSVLDVYGQWEGKGQTTPSHQHSKLLLLDYPNTPENDAKVEAIRTAWKLRTHEHSVLKVTQPANVSF